MLLKILLLLISLIFLLGGGLCSFFLLFNVSNLFKLLGLIMFAVALWAVVDVIRWDPKGENAKAKRFQAVCLVVASIAMVVTLYALTVFDIIHVNF